MKRGDIALVAGGTYSSKPRPALVLQDDHFDATDSVMVCPFTTAAVDAPMLRLPVAADGTNGLSRDSWLMVDKLTTVRRSNTREVIGRLADGQLTELERLLIVFLGLAR